MCSRILYATGYGTFILGRSMDWNDPDAATSLWVFPAGLERDGGTGDGAITWTSTYGSVITAFYDAATADGINEKGLAGNILYLAEADYGDAAALGRPTLSVGAWLQYILDNYANVDEAVGALERNPFTVIAPTLPNGRAATAHLSLSDPSGDSAILEYIDGELVIHHGPAFQVMTNSPVYDQQLALNAYWDLIGGNRMLPGTINAADRFVRLSYALKSSPKYEHPRMAVASVFSQVRAISVPLGMEDPDHPNISATLWRSIADHGEGRYYFESAIRPTVFWVDLDKVDLSAGATSKRLDVYVDEPLSGEVSGAFEAAEPFAWL